MDSNDPKFKFGQRKLSTKNHAIANTLRDVYEKKDDPNVGYILYNDQVNSMIRQMISDTNINYKKIALWVTTQYLTSRPTCGTSPAGCRVWAPHCRGLGLGLTISLSLSLRRPPNHGIHRQLPDRNWSRTYGHTKGDLALDRSSGWWLVHSLPRFPPKAEDGYSLSSNAYYMGQSFLCLSLAVDEFEAVGQHLQYAFPWAYDSKIPDWVQKRFPHLWRSIP
jgi:hypothetical protein